MKVGILTINGFNCGSFLQAFALKKAIEELNHEAHIINTMKISNFINTIIDPNPFSSFELKKAFNFVSEWKKQKVTSRVHGYDVIVIGSDVVWRDTSDTKLSNMFYANNISADKIIAYAPCCDKTTYSDLDQKKKEGIRRIDFLSARDDNTAELIEKITGEKPRIVLDPAFLIDWRIYEVASNINNFVLVYSYAKGYKKNYRDLVIQAKHIALNTNKKIIHAMKNESWCDICIPAKPFEFLGLIRSSDFVFTESFHGTVFSLLYKKPFASFPRSHKVEHLLDLFGIKKNTVFSDHSKIELNLKQKITDSKAFLKNALKD